VRESALWKKFRGCVPPGAMAVRVENSAGEGMPDVLMAYHGMVALIELKTESEISSTQSDWHRRWNEAGGESWFLIQEDKRLYLIPGTSPSGAWSKWLIKDCRQAIDRIFGITYHEKTK
jgi:hypothetical protein